MVWQELSVNDFLALKRALLLDVRSPGEHAEASIPGSLNIPLLDDAERALVGTIYRQQGEKVARRQALKLISKKIPVLLDDICALDREHGQPIVVYCWRGGLRSEAVVSLLNIAGLSCFRLTGGFKSWRSRVIADLNGELDYVQPVVLHGLTGVGKTDILKILASRQLQIVDLEQFANHRGSVFGGMGMGVQPSQKNFDAMIWQCIRALKPGFVFLEAESRKIGRLALPDLVYKRMIHRGIPVLVTGSLVHRARRILLDYLSSDWKYQLSESIDLLAQLRERIGEKKCDLVKSIIQAGKPEDALCLILSDYYDPHYRKHIERVAPYALAVSGDNPELAAQAIIDWLARKSANTVTDKSPAIAFAAS